MSKALMPGLLPAGITTSNDSRPIVISDATAGVETIPSKTRARTTGRFIRLPPPDRDSVLFQVLCELPPVKSRAARPFDTPNRDIIGLSKYPAHASQSLYRQADRRGGDRGLRQANPDFPALALAARAGLRHCIERMEFLAAGEGNHRTRQSESIVYPHHLQPDPGDRFRGPYGELHPAAHQSRCGGMRRWLRIYRVCARLGPWRRPPLGAQSL